MGIWSRMAGDGEQSEGQALDWIAKKLRQKKEREAEEAKRIQQENESALKGIFGSDDDTKKDES